MDEKKFCSAVVVAAGKGTRFGSDIPKQFLEIGGKPVLYYSLKALCDSDIIDEIIIVTSEEWIDFVTEEIVRKYEMEKVQAIVLGGDERYDSVFAGLMSVDISADYVYIHDGARPMLTEDILRRGFETVSKYGTAVAAIPSSDTVKITDEDMTVTSTPDRNSVWRIQTPQIFEYDMIIKAYFSLTDEDKKGLTDDAMIIERKTDNPVHLFIGSEDNIKITSPGDLEIAKQKLSK
jgi:2-C-methyl-D-erythritol 4-phosphate cytidylyltransferase